MQWQAYHLTHLPRVGHKQAVALLSNISCPVPLRLGDRADITTSICDTSNCIVAYSGDGIVVYCRIL